MSSIRTPDEMCLKNRARARAGRPLAGWLGSALTALALIATPGCQTTAPAVRYAPAELLDLETRSIELLLRAAEGEDDAACNAIEALVRVAPRDGLPLFRRAAQSTSPLVRYAGLLSLGDVRDVASLPLIEQATNDNSAHVRLAAAFAACRCGQDGYARLLTRNLTDAPVESMRVDSATMLGRLGEPRAKRWLLAALRFPANRRSSEVTSALWCALAMLGHGPATRQLIYDATQADIPGRTRALLTLIELGDSRAYDVFRYWLLSKEDENLETRLIAARGLGRLGSREGFDLAYQMLTYADTNRNATPDNPDRTFPVRSMAIHALGEMGDARALPALRKIAREENDPRLQVAACYSIIRIVQQARSSPNS